MGAVWALAAVLGTLVAVLLPAGAVHDVLALGHDLVALLKGSLAVVAGAVDLYAVVDRGRTGIVGDMAVYEHPVGDEGHDDLQHEIDEGEQHEGGHDAEQDDLRVGEAIDDDGRVDIADAVDGAGRADGPSVVVDGEVQVHGLSGVDLVVGVFEVEAVVGVVDIEGGEDVGEQRFPLEPPLILATRGLTEPLHDGDGLVVACIAAAEVDVVYRRVAGVRAGLQEAVLQFEVARIYRYVVDIDIAVGEDASGLLLPRERLPGEHLVHLGRHGAVEQFSIRSCGSRSA